MKTKVEAARKKGMCSAIVGQRERGGGGQGGERERAAVKQLFFQSGKSRGYYNDKFQRKDQYFDPQSKHSESEKKDKNLENHVFPFLQWAGQSMTTTMAHILTVSIHVHMYSRIYT